MWTFAPSRTTTRSSRCSGGRAAAASSARAAGNAPAVRPSASLSRARSSAFHKRSSPNGPRLERPHRVLIVSRDENHRDSRIDQLQHLEAVEFRHLYVQKHQIRLLLRDGLDRLETVRAFRRHLHAPVRVQILAQQLPRQRLVIDDRHP